MPFQAEEHARIVSVERLRPGDHAFASYTDEESRWATIGSYAHAGISRGERVLLFADPALPNATVLEHLEAYGPPVGFSVRRGQLKLLAMDRMWRPRPLSVERQMAGLRREVEEALDDGYARVRSAIDMAWVAAFGADIEQVLWREREGCHYLFDDARYTEICTYDETRFSDEVLDRASAGHPTALLERPGSLLAAPLTEGGDDTYGLRLIGEADLSTRERFDDALRRVAASPAPRLVLDLTELTFLDVYCARAVLRLAAAAHGRHVVVRGGGIHTHTFLLLGALDIPQLTVEGE
ncbi:MEDS domain-containing protein [Streptomyces rimosus]|uniref:MEDS domain-containing protein n=1 Tax=Streptomyces TaxID=1883 RepID=UPI00067CDE64|nr:MULTISPECIES: MEDS domain-containing protein [Streptomyces]RSO45558.1 STAS domain-containing protein [Streptomyces sp. WAC 06725]